MKKIPFVKLFIGIFIFIQAHALLSEAQSLVTKSYVKQYVLTKHDMYSIDDGENALITADSLMVLMENQPEFDRSMQKLHIIMWTLTLFKWLIIFALVFLLKLYVDWKWSNKCNDSAGAINH